MNGIDPWLLVIYQNVVYIFPQRSWAEAAASSHAFELRVCDHMVVFVLYCKSSNLRSLCSLGLTLSLVEPVQRRRRRHEAIIENSTRKEEAEEEEVVKEK